MTNFYSYIKTKLISAALYISCCFALSCENDEKTIKELFEKVSMVEEAVDINSLISQGGLIKARMIAPLMLRHQDDTAYYEFPKTINVEFFNDSTLVENRLHARYARYYENMNQVFLRDSVVVYSLKGDTLRCPELWWDQSTQKFYTDKPVWIHTRDKRIYGEKGMEAGQDFSWYIIKQPTGTALVADESLPD
jgi:LPS export ABC transporter protein LptC